VFVRVQTSASTDCGPLRTGKNPAIERLESKRGKLFQIAVHDNSEDGIVHDVGVKDHDEASRGMSESDLTACPHRASLGHESHVGMGRAPSTEDVPALVPGPIIDNNVFEIEAREHPVNRFEMSTKGVG